MSSGMNWDKVRRQRQLQQQPLNTQPKKKTLHARYGRFGRCMRTLDGGKRCPYAINGRGKVLCDMHLKEETLVT